MGLSALEGPQNFSPFLSLTTANQVAFVPRIVPTNPWVFAAKASSPEATGELGIGQEGTTLSTLTGAHSIEQPYK